MSTLYGVPLNFERTAESVEHQKNRDRLHDVKDIIPDDQRQIDDLHCKLRFLWRKKEPVNRFEYDAIMAALQVILSEYSSCADYQIIKDYEYSCSNLIHSRMQKYGSVTK